VFDLGFQELIVIFAVALLVFGPRRLPELARSMGKMLGQIRRAMHDVKAEIDREVAIGESPDALGRPRVERAAPGQGLNPPPEQPEPRDPTAYEQAIKEATSRPEALEGEEAESPFEGMPEGGINPMPRDETPGEAPADDDGPSGGTEEGAPR
jgi:Tat protein translocase TatB subunit